MGASHLSAAVFCASLVAACSQVPGRELTCDDIPGWIGPSPQPTAEKQYELIEQCVHKWGYRFALAPGSNSEIARAVVYQCQEAVGDYRALRLREKNPISDAERARLEQELFGMALARVTQQRAGKCSLEPKR